MSFRYGFVCCETETIQKYIVALWVKLALSHSQSKFFPTSPVHREGKPQRLTARVKIASAPVFPTIPQPRFAGGANFRFVCLSACVRQSVVPERRPTQIWEQKRCSLLLRTRQPKFLHRPKRLRCNSDPAGAATPQIAPPTRAPAGRSRLTDARHSRHARSRSHHGHRSATVTPESLQAAGKLPCATTLSSLDAAAVADAADAAVVTRRRRRVTSFAFPSGGAPTGASLHIDRLPLQRRRPRRRVCRLRRLRPALLPALPASCSPRCAETCNWASDADCDDGGPGSGSARPGPTACGTGPSSHVETKVTNVCT